MATTLDERRRPQPEPDDREAAHSRIPELGDWLQYWLRLCERRGIRPGTVQSYRNVISLYVPERLQEIALHRITSRDLDELYDHLLSEGRQDRKGGLSARTVRYVHTVLNRAFADAIRHGLLELNPAQGAYPPSQRATRAPVFPVWSAAELKRFLASARGKPFYAAFHLAATTGLRRSELLGLRWRDLDLERRQLQVIQTVIMIGRNVCIGKPKTDSSRRLVALDLTTVTVLKAHRESARSRCPDIATFDDGALVFSDASGHPIHPALFSYHFQRRVELSGVRRIRLHDLRHTHATMALQAGIHPKIVSERLGHSSITVTLDIYSHALPSMQGEAAEAIAALLADEPDRAKSAAA